MGRSSYQQRLAMRFTLPRLVADVGTVFVPPYPVDLERYGDTLSECEPQDDPALTAFERLMDAERYELVLSLSWGRGGSPFSTLDLGLLRADGEKLFVVHQLNDDAGTSLVIAYLSADSPRQLLPLFLIDYMASRGTGYTVSLPGTLPERMWIARTDLVSHAEVAAALLSLVSPASIDWNMLAPAAGDPGRRAALIARSPSLMA